MSFRRRISTRDSALPVLKCLKLLMWLSYELDLFVWYPDFLYLHTVRAFFFIRRKQPVEILTWRFFLNIFGENATLRSNFSRKLSDRINSVLLRSKWAIKHDHSFTLSKVDRLFIFKTDLTKQLLLLEQDQLTRSFLGQSILQPAQ